MNRLLFLLTFIFICAVGCKKDFPVSSNGTPLFYFNGIINGAPVNIQAGVNNYYMYSSFKQDTNNVYNFFGELRQNNCTNCNNKIRFQINDNKVSPLNGNTEINTSLTTNFYPIQGLDSLIGTPTDYVVNFSSLASLNSTVAAYSWDFGDGTTDPTANPTHTYSHPGYYNTCLTITYSNNCTSSICNQVKIGVPESGCSTSIIDSALSGNTVSLSTFQTGNPPYTFIVDFGDGITLSGTSTTGFYNHHLYANSGIYKVCLQITDGGGCTSNVCKNVSTQGFAGCLSNFDFSVLGVNSNSLSLSNVIITWTDNSGNEYTSNTNSQSSDSYFQIVSVESYLNNENNKPTKKLHVKLKCLLFKGSSSIQIDNGDAVIAVSYK